MDGGLSRGCGRRLGSTHGRRGARRRRAQAPRRGAHLRVGHQPVRAGAPGEPARADDPAPGRGRGAQAGRPVPPHPVLGRLRPAAPGPGRGRPVLRRAHRPAAERGARPVRPAPELGRALQGAAARVAGPARRPRHRDQPDPDVHLRRLHRPDHPRDAPPGRHRRGPGQVPDQAISRAGRRRAAERHRASTTRSSRTARPAGGTTPRSPASTTRPPRSPTPAPAARASARCRSPRWPGSWSGRSTGRCAGPTSA